MALGPLLIPDSSRFLVIILSLVMIVLQVLPLEWQAQLAFDRDKLLDGQYWRVITAHFLHLSWLHLAFNLLMLLLFRPLFSIPITCQKLLTLCLLLSVMVSSGLFWVSPEIVRYVGFSGILIGLYCYAGLSTLKQQPLVGGLILLIVATKVVMEQWAGNAITTSSFSGIPTVVDAHLYGVIAGSLLWLANLLITHLLTLAIKQDD